MGIKPKAMALIGGTNQNEGHTPPNFGAQPVRPGAYRGLDEQGSNVIQGHEKADEGWGQVKLVGEKKGNERVVEGPNNADTEKTKS